MNFCEKLNYIYKHIGQEKLFLTFFAALVPMFYSLEIFKTGISDIVKGVELIVSFVFLHFAVCIFDDFMDWISGQTNRRHEIEQLGIRGNYSKCSHFYIDKKSPRKYLLLSFVFFTLFLISFSILAITTNKYILLIILPLILLTGFILYSDLGKKITKCIGCEFFTVFLIAPISMITVFYTMTNHLTLKFFYVSLIFFFLVFNVVYTMSLLNYKQDKSINKQTLSVIFDNANFKIYFSLLLSVIQYLLILIGIALKIFTNIYYVVFISLPFTLWHFYLMFLFEKSPQKQIKWHFLMGSDAKNVIYEQENLSWYYVRYHFARNIFIFETILYIFCTINFEMVLAF